MRSRGTRDKRRKEEEYSDHIDWDDWDCCDLSECTQSEWEDAVYVEPVCLVKNEVDLGKSTPKDWREFLRKLEEDLSSD